LHAPFVLRCHSASRIARFLGARKYFLREFSGRYSGRFWPRTWGCQGACSAEAFPSDLRVMSPLCSFSRSACLFISYRSDRQLGFDSSMTNISHIRHDAQQFSCTLVAPGPENWAEKPVGVRPNVACEGFELACLPSGFPVEGVISRPFSSAC